MRKKGFKWISILAAAAMFMVSAAPVPAQENEPVPEVVQEALPETAVAAEPAPATEEYAGENVSDASVEETVIAEPAAEEPAAAAETSEEVAPAVGEADAAVTENTADPAAAEKEQSAEEEAEEAVEAEAEEELQQAEEEAPSVTYHTHIQTFGWEKDWKKDGATSGTIGQSKRLEGIEIKVDGVEGLGISYRTHVQGIGWQGYVSDGEMAGTKGQSRRLEAIQIKLTGEKAADYDVYYCVHVQTYGWLNWAKNDEMAGTSGYSRRLEGICIKIQKKDEAAPAPLGTRSVAALHGKVAYQTHVQSYGWQGYVTDGATSGTTGQSKRLEGIQIRFADQPLPGYIQYRTHIQGIGWENGWRGTDMVSGTTGQSRRLEAIQIRLYDDPRSEYKITSEYDIWYRTHVQKYGWSGWAKNGTSCGSEGISYRLESIQIKLLPKGSPAPGSTENNLFTKTIEESLGDSLMVKAYKYVNSITNASMTKEQKLRICFDNFINYREVLVYFPVYTGTDWPQVYANHFFDTWSGDCLTYASAFAYMAKVIGYDNVYALNSTGHGWAEINDTIYDPEFSLHSYDMYGLPYSAVPAYLNVRNAAGPGNTYRMKI